MRPFRRAGIDPAPPPRHPAPVLRAFKLSIGQLGDSAILAVLAKSLATTLLLFALVGGLYWYAVDAWLNVVRSGFTAVIAIAAAIATACLFFRIVAIAVIGIFADDVVEAVERRHYPEMLAKARPIGIARSAAMGLGGASRALLVNALLLPVYLLALVAGVVGAPLIFLAANAWLLGRDLGDMVAVRHLASAELPRWRRGTSASRFALGGVGTGLFLVPVIGLLAPIIAAAMATHMFHDEAPT